MADVVAAQGDDRSLEIVLKKQNATFAIDSSAVIKASFTNRATKIVELADVPITEVSGSDWANSLIVLQLTSAQTSGLTLGSYEMDIQVNDGGEVTFFLDDYLLIKPNRVT